MCVRFDGNLADDRRARCTVLYLVVLRIETGNLWRRGKGSSRMGQQMGGSFECFGGRRSDRGELRGNVISASLRCGKLTL